ncbi:hypothetical protein AD006_29470 (plasmid) [Pseudonocardia sp. EC080610-09]|uniref:hypothetical protein n=1 Tax=unclassified Pseudonocardia TaxID=2619320 RepID=UPI000706DD2D|nr:MULTISPECIES: hypothetical protein [unclassified Pseudonocardia]ALL79403.1 hypothetical protein AD006_29470 [Pseudonocardia sp. EC080610-09]ALL85643.1 hypothetical protein AD017_31780 [Pseudonocardia sp. EC080619-01]
MIAWAAVHLAAAAIGVVLIAHSTQEHVLAHEAPGAISGLALVGAVTTLTFTALALVLCLRLVLGLHGIATTSTCLFVGTAFGTVVIDRAHVGGIVESWPSVCFEVLHTSDLTDVASGVAARIHRLLRRTTMRVSVFELPVNTAAVVDGLQRNST